MKNTNKDIDRYINVANKWEKKYSEARLERDKLLRDTSCLETKLSNARYDKDEAVNLAEKYRKDAEYYQTRFYLSFFTLIISVALLIAEKFL